MTSQEFLKSKSGKNREGNEESGQWGENILTIVKLGSLL